jgi:hypothetical protein
MLLGWNTLHLLCEGSASSKHCLRVVGVEGSTPNQPTWGAWKYHGVDDTLCNTLPSAADKANLALYATRSCSLLLVLHYTVLAVVS